MMDHQNSVILGIDLGGTKILTAVVDKKGHMQSRDYAATPAEEGPDAVMGAILASAGRTLDKISLDWHNVDVVGIGAPGPSNPEAGLLYTSPNLPGWQNVPIVRMLREKTEKAVYLINDANAAALAEHQFGAAKGLEHMIYITVSTGIGGGIIAGGRLLTGAVGCAGELGHMTIDPNGPACSCGNTGCWETLASGSALARQARQKLRDGEKTLISDLVSGNIDRVDAEMVHKAAEQGDRLAEELIFRTARYLGVGLANLMNIFNPEMIVIGGGLANMGDRLLSPAIETARKRAYDIAFSSVAFRLAELGEDNGVLGAAAYAEKKHFKA